MTHPGPFPQDTSLKTIVVGYDGTRPSERALARAAALARAFGSTVVIADLAAPEPLQAMPGAFGLGPYHRYTPEQGIRATHQSRAYALTKQFGVSTAVGSRPSSPTAGSRTSSPA